MQSPRRAAQREELFESRNHQVKGSWDPTVRMAQMAETGETAETRETAELVDTRSVTARTLSFTIFLPSLTKCLDAITCQSLSCIIALHT